MTIGELLNSIGNSISSSIVGIGWFFKDMIFKLKNGDILDLSILQGIFLLIPIVMIFSSISSWSTHKWEDFGIFLEKYCKGKRIKPSTIKTVVVLFLYILLCVGVLSLIIYLDYSDRQ